MVINRKINIDIDKPSSSAFLIPFRYLLDIATQKKKIPKIFSFRVEPQHMNGLRKKKGKKAEKEKKSFLSGFRKREDGKFMAKQYRHNTIPNHPSSLSENKKKVNKSPNSIIIKHLRCTRSKKKKKLLREKNQ